MSSGDLDLYGLLEVDETADEEEITLAFRRMAKRWHPDLNTTPEAGNRMKYITAAYEVLRDPERRADYDRALHREPAAPDARADPAVPQRPSGPLGVWAAVMPGFSAVDDPSPPVGCRTAPSWFPRNWSARERRRFGRVLAVPLLVVCPGLPFVLAAASGAQTVARWSALYIAAEALWAIGTLSGAGVVAHLAAPLVILGAAHVVRGRKELLSGHDGIGSSWN